MTSEFDLKNLGKAFRSCVNEDGTLDMDHYILAFVEIHKFLSLLGSVFSFVASEVDGKLELIKKQRNDPEKGSHYGTIESMIQYELKENIINFKVLYSMNCLNLLNIY